MMDVLKDLGKVVLHVDDMLIHGSCKEEHDKTLREVLKRLKKDGVTLNEENCAFRVSSVRFLEHVIDDNGVRPDPQKVEAICSMKPPEDVTGMKRFLGLANFLARFIPHLSTECQPLYELAKEDRDFIWGPSQVRAFQILMEEPTLALYDQGKETIVSSDASSYGLGSVILQKQDDRIWKPVAYASRL